MIKPLRKRHLQIWTGLALLLPLALVAGWLVIPAKVYDYLLQPAAGKPLPVLIRAIQKTGYSLQLRRAADSPLFQLVWINDQALTSPSALIYQRSSPDTAEEPGSLPLIGRIDARGTYYFPVSGASADKGFDFLVYDIIHHHVIDHIKF